MKPTVLAILPGIAPSTLLCVIQPMLELQQRGLVNFRLCLQPHFRPRLLHGVDLVQFCRNADPRYAAILQAVQRAGIPYTYDLDDDLFNVPSDTLDGQYYNDPCTAQQLETYLRHAALVRVYSHPLLERIKSLNPHTHLLRAPIDLIRLYPMPKDSAAPPKIIYATSRRNDHLYPLFEAALLRLVQVHSEVQLVFWGFLPPAFKERPNVAFLPYEPNYARFQDSFSRMGFDIGLAPLLDDDFHRAKTDNKVREYGACGIAGVYSNVSVYAEGVQDGVTGLLVENTPESWYSALIRLVEHPEQRRLMGQAARRAVEARYAREAFLQTWQEHIQQALAVQARPAEPASAAPIESPDRLRRAFELLRRGRLSEFGQQGRAYLDSWWWQFKINRLKRL